MIITSRASFTLAVVATVGCSIYDDGVVLLARDGGPPDGMPSVADAGPGADVDLRPGVDRSDCNAELSCPSTGEGLVSLCGRLYDIETGAHVGADAPTGDPCLDSSDERCPLALTAYDPLALVTDPAGAEPLPIEHLEIDDCGRYRAIGVRRPFNGFIALVADDAGAADEYAPTVIAAGPAGETTTGLRVYATRRSTDEKWTDTAGDPFGGDTFATRGAVLALFEADGAPSTSVTMTGGAEVTDAFYFDDAASSVASIDPALTTTGPNGAAIAIEIDLTQIGGDGGLDAGCHWVARLAGSVPTMVFAVELSPECS